MYGRMEESSTHTLNHVIRWACHPTASAAFTPALSNFAFIAVKVLNGRVPFYTFFARWIGNTKCLLDCLFCTRKPLNGYPCNSKCTFCRFKFVLLIERKRLLFSVWWIFCLWSSVHLCETASLLPVFCPPVWNSFAVIARFVRTELHCKQSNGDKVSVRILE